MSTHSILYKRELAINDKIKIMIPSVGEVLDDEDEYYSMVSSMTAMPVDYMWQLQDINIDFTEISEYELFILMFEGIKKRDTHLIFGDLDINKLIFDESSFSFYDAENDIRIERGIQMQIASALRKIHHLEKNRKKPGNKEAKEYMIERARVKAMRNRHRSVDSQLESLIIALVNTEQFKYDFDSVLDMSIYQFNESVRQIIHKVDYEHRMAGIYAGTIDPKKMSQDDLNWLKHK